MIKYALFAKFDAKPGKESAVESFLEAALGMANDEATTPIWFALRLSERTFGVFDAFSDEADLQAHLDGPIAEALKSHAEELFTGAPTVEKIKVLGIKNLAH